MQHKDRHVLMEGLLDVVARTCGEAVVARVRPALEERLEGLLNDFLLESQPTLATDVTILLADLRGFTAIAESYPGGVVIEVLNRYFAAMGEVVARQGGAVDKFMGDAVMALFGAPLRCDDHLPRALNCAVHMQQAMERVNTANELCGQPRIYAGIGINTGRVMAGSFGSAAHNEYTVIGDQVNLAARIEAYSLRGQVLVSEAVRSRAADYIETGHCNRVMVKGKHEPVPLYELIAVTRPERLEVPRVEVRRSPRIRVDLPLVFRRVENKRVLPETFRGRVLDLGYHGLCASLPMHLDALSELVMTLSPELTGAATPTDLYARVVRCHARHGVFVGSLAFTSEETPGHLAVKRYVDHALWGR